MIHRLALTLAAAVVLPACARAEATVGAAAPDFTLPDLAGKAHHLADYQGKVVVLEWMNPNCPFSRRHAEEGTMTRLVAAHSDLVWLGITSTAKEHGDYVSPQQYTSYDREHKIDYPVLYDTEGKVGHAYGARTTPHMFVIDEKGTVIYRGAIDDDPYGRAKARKNYVEAALTDHAAGKPVQTASTNAYGCSVKY